MNKQRQCSLHFAAMTCIKSHSSTDEVYFWKEKENEMYKIDNTKVDN